MNIKYKWLYVFLAINIFSVVYYILYFIKFNHTPAPFLYDKDDTFMDFFNTLYWSYDVNRYEIWQSIYPPLNFLFLKLVNLIISGGFYTEPFDMRHNGQNLILFIIVSFMLMPLIILKSYDWLHAREKICVYFIFILSAPFLFTLERGNLIVFSLPIFYFFFNSEKLSKVFFLSILVNIKPYFGVFIITDFLKKNYYELFTFFLFISVIYAFTSVMMGPEFLGFIKNFFIFNESVFSLREVMALPSTILSHIIFFSNVEPSFLVNIFIQKYLIVNFLYCGYLLLLLLFLFTIIFFRNKLCSRELICLLIIGITNFFYQVGGYTIIFYFIIIPYIYKNYRLLLFFFISLFMLLDMIELYSEILSQRYSYLYGGYTEINYSLGAGSLIRPILNYLLLFFMCYLILGKYTNINLPYIGKLNEK